jgi:hypothetical protein
MAYRGDVARHGERRGLGSSLPDWPTPAEGARLPSRGARRADAYLVTSFAEPELHANHPPRKNERSHACPHTCTAY